MEQSTLQDILGVEKTIREELDAEREKASEWLETARREIEREHLAELETIRREAAQAEDRAREAALAQAADAKSGRSLQSAADLTDDELGRRVLESLTVILPEALRAR